MFIEYKKWIKKIELRKTLLSFNLPCENRGQYMPTKKQVIFQNNIIKIFYIRVFPNWILYTFYILFLVILK